MEGLKQAAISKIVIERPHKKCRVNIHSARPGRRDRQEGRGHRQAAQAGREADEVGSRDQHRRSAQAEVDATLIADFDRPAARAPRRVPPRHEARRAVGDASRRRRHPYQLLRPSRRRRNRAPRVVSRGRVPLHTLRADVDYGVATAHTAYGTAASRFGCSRANPRARSDGAGPEMARGGHHQPIASVVTAMANA